MAEPSVQRPGAFWMHAPRWYESPRVFLGYCLVVAAGASLGVVWVGKCTPQVGGAFIYGVALCLFAHWYSRRLFPASGEWRAERYIRPTYFAKTPHSMPEEPQRAFGAVTGAVLGLTIATFLIILRAEELLFAFMAGAAVGAIPSYWRMEPAWRRAWEIYREKSGRFPRAVG